MKFWKKFNLMHDIKGHLGPFLTAMTFDRIRVVTYMTKISFLTAFFSVRLRAPKRLAWFHVEQYSTDFVLCLCEQEKKPRCLLRAVLNRAKKGTILVQSVHFWHFRQLPKNGPQTIEGVGNCRFIAK